MFLKLIPLFLLNLSAHAQTWPAVDRADMSPQPCMDYIVIHNSSYQARPDDFTMQRIQKACLGNVGTGCLEFISDASMTFNLEELIVTAVACRGNVGSNCVRSALDNPEIAKASLLDNARICGNGYNHD